jgi:hypothetical protein
MDGPANDPEGSKRRASIVPEWSERRARVVPEWSRLDNIKSTRGAIKMPSSGYQLDLESLRG